MLKDAEAEVRAAAAGKIKGKCGRFQLVVVQLIFFLFFSDFAEKLPITGREQILMTHLLPCVKDLVADPNQHVKTALAAVIMGLAPILGKDKYIPRFIVYF